MRDHIATRSRQAGRCLGTTNAVARQTTVLRLTLLLCCSLVIETAPLRADTKDAPFHISLGGRTLGTLSYSSQGAGKALRAQLAATFDGTPLGIADGQFKARSRPAETSDGRHVREYTGISAFTRKNRSVLVLTDNGKVVSTTIEPTSELTDLSDPSAVTVDVLDPAEAFGMLLVPANCPAPLRIYDGRRVSVVSFETSVASSTGTVCHGSYRVTNGPGLLSPLGIKSVGLDIAYGPKIDGRARATMMEMSSGPFVLTFWR